MKVKFIHKITVIQEKFLVFFNLLRGPDVTRGPTIYDVHTEGVSDSDGRMRTGKADSAPRGCPLTKYLN